MCHRKGYKDRESLRLQAGERSYRSVKKGERYTGVVERMEFPNRGIVMIDGERAIVKNALPG